MSSHYLREQYQSLQPYRLGAQPHDREYIKLNSNETSMPPSPRVLAAIRAAAALPDLGHYSDQDGDVLRAALGHCYHLSPEQFLVGNGADEMLSFCLRAYCDSHAGVCFPDITYGFYKTVCEAENIDYREIPLDEQFRIRPEDYCHAGRTVVIANPNAPTGLRLSTVQLRQVLESNLENIVIIDEAYVDFETESCIPLLAEYPNLIVVHTMSKSRNIAGLHVGYAAGSRELMQELNDLKNCFNPNNLNQVTLDAAVAAVEDETYTKACCAEKVRVRQQVEQQLLRFGFQVVPSYTNFLFFTHPKISAVQLEQKLVEHGVLTRHYAQPRIDNFLRMSIGTAQEMQVVQQALCEIMSAVG